MNPSRFLPLAFALIAASTLVACGTAPSMPVGTASAASMATPQHMASMDAQMMNMRGMHEKMKAAKTPEERSKLMAEHMKAMQDGMQMMGAMGSGGMGEMKGMQGQQMMEKRMQMMETMMPMMMDRMQAAPAR